MLSTKKITIFISKIKNLHWTSLYNKGWNLDDDINPIEEMYRIY